MAQFLHFSFYSLPFWLIVLLLGGFLPTKLSWFDEFMLSKRCCCDSRSKSLVSKLSATRFFGLVGIGWISVWEMSCSLWPGYEIADSPMSMCELVTLEDRKELMPRRF